MSIDNYSLGDLTFTFSLVSIMNSIHPIIKFTQPLQHLGEEFNTYRELTEIAEIAKNAQVAKLADLEKIQNLQTC